MTSIYPGVYANLANEEIFTFVQKWKSIDSIFTSERSDYEWRDLLKTMTNLDPVNSMTHEPGILLKNPLGGSVKKSR